MCLDNTICLALSQNCEPKFIHIFIFLTPLLFLILLLSVMKCMDLAIWSEKKKAQTKKSNVFLMMLKSYLTFLKSGDYKPQLVV